MKKIGIVICISITICIGIATSIYYTLDNVEISPNIEEEVLLETNEDLKWELSIPKIYLEKVSIEEGVGKEILERSIGHFSNTSITGGNVCLASHNRAEKGMYFKDLDKLKIGDKIIYSTFYEKFEYEIYEIEKIKDTNVDVLNPSDINILTLITCIENSPHLRLCIKAKEVEKIEEDY